MRTELIRLMAASFAVCVACNNSPDSSQSGADASSDSSGDGGVSNDNDANIGTGDGFEVYKSGTRLRARRVVSADGAEQFVGFRDLDLNIDCFIQKFEGQTLCLPSMLGIQDGPFSDAGCSAPTAIASALSCLDSEWTHARTYNPGCTNSIHFVGSKLPTIYQGTPGNCVEAALNPGLEYYSVGAIVGLSTFQSATEVVE